MSKTAQIRWLNPIVWVRAWNRSSVETQLYIFWLMHFVAAMGVVLFLFSLPASRHENGTARGPWLAAFIGYFLPMYAALWFDHRKIFDTRKDFLFLSLMPGIRQLIFFTVEFPRGAYHLAYDLWFVLVSVWRSARQRSAGQVTRRILHWLKPIVWARAWRFASVRNKAAVLFLFHVVLVFALVAMDSTGVLLDGGHVTFITIVYLILLAGILLYLDNPPSKHKIRFFLFITPVIGPPVALLAFLWFVCKTVVYALRFVYLQRKGRLKA